MSIGIYKITNKQNNKCYIGRSTQVEHRLREHQLRAFRPPEKNKEYDKALYQAIRKYGVENFTYEMIKECSIEELDYWENYYIQFYHSNQANKGYNETSGYDKNQYGVAGEAHPNHKLTEQDVYYIREQYNQHRDKMLVYEEFKDRINFTGFHKIWNNITWPNVHQDVYTEENKQYWLFQRNSHPGERNPKAKLTEHEVYDIREKYGQQTPKEIVYNQYKDKIGRGGFDMIWVGKNWKNVHMDVYTEENKLFHKEHPMPSTPKTHPNAILTEEDVRDIRTKQKQGISKKEIFKEYIQKKNCSRSCLEHVWQRHTWTKIDV